MTDEPEPYHYDVMDDLDHFSKEKLEKMYYRLSMDYRVGDVGYDQTEFREHVERMGRIESALRDVGGDPDEVASQVEKDLEEWRMEWSFETTDK